MRLLSVLCAWRRLSWLQRLLWLVSVTTLSLLLYSVYLIHDQERMVSWSHPGNPHSNQPHHYSNQEHYRGNQQSQHSNQLHHHGNQQHHPMLNHHDNQQFDGYHEQDSDDNHSNKQNFHIPLPGGGISNYQDEIEDLVQEAQGQKVPQNIQGQLNLNVDINSDHNVDINSDNNADITSDKKMKHKGGLELQAVDIRADNEEIDIPVELRQELWPQRRRNRVDSQSAGGYHGGSYHGDGNHGGGGGGRRHRTAAPVSDTNRIFVDTLGFLGKQLFQYAALIGIARDTGKDPWLSDRSILRGVFTNISADRGYDPRARIYIEDGAGTHSPAIVRHQWGDMAICCYLQSWRYFRTHEAELRQHLTFEAGIATLATNHLQAVVAEFVTSQLIGGNNQRLYEAATSNTAVRPGLEVGGKIFNFHYVGVHVRQAGLYSRRHVRQGYVPAPVTYLKHAVQYYRKKYLNAVFIIVSDDMAWCRANITTTNMGGDRDFVLTKGSSPPTVDLAILSQCNDTIMTGGAFGWWGGWLAGGEVVYWDGWMREGSDVANSYRSWDYYPPMWKAMGEK